MMGQVKEHSPQGKYQCTADLLFYRFEFDQSGKTAVHSAKAKQLNPNKIKKRSAIQNNYKYKVSEYCLPILSVILPPTYGERSLIRWDSSWQPKIEACFFFEVFMCVPEKLNYQLKVNDQVALKMGTSLIRFDLKSIEVITFQLL